MLIIKYVLYLRMTQYELLELLRSRRFFKEQNTGIIYRFIENSVNINGIPQAHFSIIEKNGDFFMDVKLGNTSPLKVHIERAMNPLTIHLADEFKPLSFYLHLVEDF